MKTEVLKIADRSGLGMLDLSWHDSIERFAAAIRSAVKEEDARICERTKGLDRQGWPKHYEAHEIAKAILASK